MPIAVPHYTVDEIESWPDDGNRYELLDGVLLVTPGPGPGHQIVANRIAFALTGFLEPWPDIQVVGPGVIVRRPSTQLQPDVLVFRAPPGELHWERMTAHLLAVEVMSWSSRVYDRDYKRPAYQALGVAEYWRVDPRERAVYVSRASDPVERECRDGLVWAPPGLGESLELPLARVFRGV